MGEKKSREQFKQLLDHFVTSIREQILNGELEVGEYLPSELILAERFSLSKNSVRKGLDELVNEGLIMKKSRVGNIVASSQLIEKVVLRVGYYPSLEKEASFLTLVEKFEKKHAHIKVQPIALPYDHYHQTVRDFFKNDLVDVVTINYNDFREFKSGPKELFEPFDWNDDVYPFLQEGFRQNHLYVMPFIFSPIVLCYNQQHFRESGLSFPDSSWTWDDLLRAANQLTAGNGHQHGFYFHPLSVNRWPIFLLQNQVYFSRDAEGEVQFDEKKLIESIHVCRNIFEEQGMMQNFLSDSDTDAEQLFAEQNVSMILASYFSLNEMKEHLIQYDIAPLPYFSDARTLLLAIGFAVNKTSLKRDIAKQFVEYMTSEEAQDTIRRETLSLPSMKKVAEMSGGERVFHPSRYSLFREIIPTYRWYTDLGVRFHELREMKNELRLYWSGLTNEELFCKRLRAKLSPSQKEWTQIGRG